jgi:hypothetical protein
VCGTTSPRPSVKKVVPLIYKSVQNVAHLRNETSAGPAAQCSKAKLKIRPAAHVMKSRRRESGP